MTLPFPTHGRQPVGIRSLEVPKPDRLLGLAFLHFSRFLP